MWNVRAVSLNDLNGAKRLNDWNGASAWMLRAARLNLDSRMFWDWTMARIESCNGKVVLSFFTAISLPSVVKFLQSWESRMFRGALKFRSDKHFSG